jgi:hypothetical protein
MRDLSQLAVKKQTDPVTAVVPDSTNVLVRLREGDAPEIPIDFNSTQEIQETSSARPSKPGIQRFQASASWILRPHATPATMPPACSLLLEMGLLKCEQVVQSAIGAVTSGPFLDGEEVIGGTSGVHARVFRPCSATPLKYTIISGGGGMTNGEVITGQTSGAHASATGSAVSRGFKYQLVDSDFLGGVYQHHATVDFLRGGYYWRGRGVLGELNFEFKNRLPCIVKSSMLGALEAQGDKAMWSMASYPDDGIAEPRFVSAALALGAYSPSDVIDFALHIPLGLDIREDAQAATGVLFADYERKNSPPTVTFEPAMVSAATFDFFQTYRNGTTFAMSWMLGDRFQFFADECQFASVGVGSRRQLATVPLTINLCGKKNNEIQIWALP